jgi:CubicO group peptidase (beta-lactamase class C family)
VFQIASISKPISALAALRLVDHNKLALDAPINAHLKGRQIPASSYTQQSPVSLRRLLSHWSDLSTQGFNGYAMDATSENVVPSTLQILNGAAPANSAAVFSLATPLIRNDYSGGGYVVVQLAMKSVTGQKFSDLVKNECSCLQV